MQREREREIHRETPTYVAQHTHREILGHRRTLISYMSATPVVNVLDIPLDFVDVTAFLAAAA